MPNPDCTLSAKGYSSSITVPLVALDYGISIVATEDMGRDNRIFYPMQVQKDMFSISAIFASKTASNYFNRWIWDYVEYASASGTQNIAVGLRVQVPNRAFDMMGFPTSGWSYHWAPVQLTDVTWVVTISFDGAAQVGGQPFINPALASQYHSPLTPGDPDQLMFYPGYYDPGSGTYTGNPSDALYRAPKKVATPAGELTQTVTKLPPGTTGVFPTDRQYKKPIGPNPVMPITHLYPTDKQYKKPIGPGLNGT